MVGFDYYELMFIAFCIAEQKDKSSHYYGIDKTYSRAKTEEKVRQLAEEVKDEEIWIDLTKHIKPSREKIVCQKIIYNYCDDSINEEYTTRGGVVKL